jgi:hypothetical protein
MTTIEQVEEFAAPSEIRRKGINALIRELGVVGMVRFLQQFEPGKGDYTKERAALLADITMDDVELFLAKAHSE